MSFHNLIISHLVEVKQTMYEIILLHYFSNKLPENKIAAQRVGGGGEGTLHPYQHFPWIRLCIEEDNPVADLSPVPLILGMQKKKN